MKVYSLLCLLLLFACAPQPQFAPESQAVPQQVGPPPVPVIQHEAPPMPAVTAQEEVGLGPVEFVIHPYTVGNKPAASVRPGTPLVAEVFVKKNSPGSPPVTEAESASTEGATILITEVGPKGDVQLYGTPNIPDILASNILRFDPSTKSWWNDKFVASADINEKIGYVIFIKYKKDVRVLKYNINVR